MTPRRPSCDPPSTTTFRPRRGPPDHPRPPVERLRPTIRDHLSSTTRKQPRFQNFNYEHDLNEVNIDPLELQLEHSLEIRQVQKLVILKVVHLCQV
ncbi:hypothetical protein QJS10_CPA07g00568 [Acorus calamus]|uniref:Uncharacterized protein n=1 Tax=Acorus calamus TaxID=4465 RepID=A0AAV9EG78_ACOCL|nr:hypothetical protein QJS10_CPA07g00568 [Acorus calamus]